MKYRSFLSYHVTKRYSKYETFQKQKNTCQELQIHPKTLNRYMKKIGFKWDKTAMPPSVWEKLLVELNSRNSSETKPKDSET
jgi:hypothetical protein